MRLFTAMDEGYINPSGYDRLYASEKENIFFNDKKEEGLKSILGEEWITISTNDYVGNSEFLIRVSYEYSTFLIEFKAFDFIIEMNEDTCLDESWDFMKFLVNFLMDRFFHHRSSNSGLSSYVTGGDDEYTYSDWNWDKILKEVAPMLPFREEDELSFQGGKSSTNIYVPDWSRKSLTSPIPYELRKLLESRAVIPKKVDDLVRNLPFQSTVEVLTESGLFKGTVGFGGESILTGSKIYKFVSEEGLTFNILDEQIFKIHHLNVPTPGVFKKRANLVI